MLTLLSLSTTATWLICPEVRRLRAGNKQCALSDGGRGTNPGILSGAQNISRIVKKSGDADCTGILIHRAVCEGYFPFLA